MSENVKIKINEYDKTSPAGSGIDSTDIAFIPGFSVLATAERNRPTLCTTVKEFEELFGTKPLKLTSRDITAEYQGYGFLPGDDDKAYVFAKELLYQGMSVVYDCIEPAEAKYKHAANTLTEFTCKTMKGEAVTGLDVRGHNYSGEDVKYIFTAAKDIDSTIKFSGDLKLPVSAGRTSMEIIGRITRGSEFAKVQNITISCEDQNVSIEELSHNQIEIFAEEVLKGSNFEVEVELKVKLTSGDSFELEFFEPDFSRLDAFYSANAAIIDALKLIEDKSLYSVKYITSGGYPSVVHGKLELNNKFATQMLAAAATRGDAVALIDDQLAIETESFNTDTSSGSFYAMMQSAFGGEVVNTEFGTAMYPWAEYSCKNTITDTIMMPASFAYLMCVAKAIKTSPNWLAMAGVSRGIVPSIKQLLTKEHNLLSNTIAEEMQPKFGAENHSVSINCITDIRPYGLTLWGNRTLKPVSPDGTVALNFLNTRNMLSDIKKLLYTTAKSLMFEQNSDTLWVRFKAGVSPLLNQLKSGNGISDYKIIKGTTKYNGDPLTKGEMAAIIRIYPVYAVEYFELAVEMSDEDVTVS